MRAFHLVMIVAMGTTAMSSDFAVADEVSSPPQATPAAPSANENAAKDDATKKVAPIEAPPASITVIDSGYARAILGRDVRSPTDENMGRIADVIVDRGGQVRAAVIDFGGFLGVGSRKIAVAWKALQFLNVASKGESITLELTRDQVKAAPEYKDDQPIVVLGASGKLERIRFRPLATDK